MCAAAVVAIYRFRVDIVWVVLGGGLIGAGAVIPALTRLAGLTGCSKNAA